jgi:hypothetical protein
MAHVHSEQYAYGENQHGRRNPPDPIVAVEERQSLQFTRRYVYTLAQQNDLHVLACESLGFITPDRMPAAVAHRVGAWNTPNPLAAYTVLIAQHRRS